jgi:hypothetical protein
MFECFGGYTGIYDASILDKEGFTVHTIRMVSEMVKIANSINLTASNNIQEVRRLQL